MRPVPFLPFVLSEGEGRATGAARAARTSTSIRRIEVHP